MTAEGHNVDANLMAIGRDHGHYFVKKTFGKPTYCHHCCDKIWGMLSQGFACEVCNFVCHDKCLRTVVSYCSGVALQLIKNPVAHTWSTPQHIKRKFCCVCRKRTDDVTSVECEVCEYYVHVDCQDLAVSDCREAATFVPSLDTVSAKQYHHFREGNLPRDSRCIDCKKTCNSFECFTGMRCEWCGVTAHAVCYRRVKKDCDLGVLRKIMLPPNAITIPRTELPMEQLLNIQVGEKKESKEKDEKDRDREGGGGGKDKDKGDGSRKVSSPSRLNADEATTTATEEKERDDYEILRIYDGNNSLRNNIFRTASISYIR
uniref:diacylglycerol kinase (ATP) n=1 Tax=Panagrolaimus superbus TaxID=310955 RepID=A0A914XZV2_9BILA